MSGKSKEEAKDFYMQSLLRFLDEEPYVNILIIYYDMQGGSRGGPFVIGEREEKRNAILQYFENVWESEENFDYETELSYQCLYRPNYIDCVFGVAHPLEAIQNREIRLRREGEEPEEPEPTTPASLPELIDTSQEPYEAYSMQSFALYEEREEDDGYTTHPTYFGIYETTDENYDTYTGEPIVHKKINIYCESSRVRPISDEKCGICWENDAEIETGCGHGFCVCIMKNIVDYKNDSCPLCKQELMALRIYNGETYETIKRECYGKVWSFV
jgi:hypothetical protein